MPVARHQLLATTALEDTWGSNEPLLFLGEWCKRYERRSVLAGREHRTAGYHWDDRAKLRQDYDRLQLFHGRLLRSLSSTLNDLHGVDHSIRYWQILLDPWLMAYVGIMLDRWECLRLAFAAESGIETIVFEGPVEKRIPFSYLEFVVDAAGSDEWNHSLFRRIIETEYASKCVIRSAAHPDTGPRATPAVARRRRTWRRRLGSTVDHLLGRLSASTDVAFVQSFFRNASLVRLNFAMGQVPRWYLDDFDFDRSLDEVPATSDSPERRAMRVDFTPESAFEHFVQRSIISFIPQSVVESFAALRDRARRVPIKTRAIVTANAHWGSVIGKAWMAEQVSQGVKLVILEHGGSLPAFKELFDFEEDISDVKGTWFLPYHKKHVRVPPSKLLPAFANALPHSTKARGSLCSIIANTCPRYAHRANFYPMTVQWLESVKLITHFHDGLGADAKRWFRVKPVPRHVDPWNSAQRYADIFGPDRIIEAAKIDSVYSASALIVCTYPETTFSEAMASGVPTILLYPDHLYERSPVALPLLATLREANVVFHDPAEAAAHVNAIWHDPWAWWNGATALKARSEFRRQAANWTGDWVKEWTGFLKGVLA